MLHIIRKKNDPYSREKATNGDQAQDEPSQLLELAHKYFKAAILTMLKDISANMLGTLSKEMEIIHI